MLNPIPRMRPLFRFLLPLGIVVGISSFTLLPMCNLLFSCGCTVAGAQHCNVHNTEAPRCPWCAHGNGVFTLAYAVALLGAAIGIASALKLSGGRMFVSTAAGIVGFGVAVSLAGLGCAIYFHYPTWFGLHI